MAGVRFIQHVLQGEIRRPKTIAEVLSKDPSTVCESNPSVNRQAPEGQSLTCISRFLHRVGDWCHSIGITEEGIIRKTVKKRSLFRDLIDGVFDWWCVGPWERIEVQAYTQASVSFNQIALDEDILMMVTPFANCSTYFLAEYSE
jgi:hypothetical protein